VQIIITTHSPNLASKSDIENIVVMCEGKAYPLKADQTKLEKSDYLFLRRFLDVTKANMFFAKGVVIVEGDAENILLPSLAKLLDRSFTNYGISIVKVGSRGLFRYSRIYQRRENSGIPIQVACIADRDIVPDEVAKYMDIGKRQLESQYSGNEINGKVNKLVSNDGGTVKTFVSPKWTLEYDIALCGLGLQMHIAIQLASKGKILSEDEKKGITDDAKKEYEGWVEEGLTKEEIAAKVYMNLHDRKASKAETAQFLAEYLETDPIPAQDLRKLLPNYIVNAIDYVTGSSNDDGS
jgi:putative ATP-dependent endonuclease of OLD family